MDIIPLQDFMRKMPPHTLKSVRKHAYEKGTTTSLIAPEERSDLADCLEAALSQDWDCYVMRWVNGGFRLIWREGLGHVVVMNTSANAARAVSKRLVIPSTFYTLRPVPPIRLATDEEIRTLHQAPNVVWKGGFPA